MRLKIVLMTSLALILVMFSGCDGGCRCDSETPPLYDSFPQTATGGSNDPHATSASIDSNEPKKKYPGLVSVWHTQQATGENIDGHKDISVEEFERMKKEILEMRAKIAARKPENSKLQQIWNSYVPKKGNGLFDDVLPEADTKPTPKK